MEKCKCPKCGLEYKEYWRNPPVDAFADGDEDSEVYLVNCACGCHFEYTLVYKLFKTKVEEVVKTEYKEEDLRPCPTASIDCPYCYLGWNTTKCAMFAEEGVEPEDECDDYATF